MCSWPLAAAKRQRQILRSPRSGRTRRGSRGRQWGTHRRLGRSGCRHHCRRSSPATGGSRCGSGACIVPSAAAGGLVEACLQLALQLSSAGSSGESSGSAPALNQRPPHVLRGRSGEGDGRALGASAPAVAGRCAEGDGCRIREGVGKVEAQLHVGLGSWQEGTNRVGQATRGGG